MKIIRTLMFLLIMLIFLLVSCEESVKMEVGSITIEEPIVSVPTDKALVTATLKIDKYMIMMTPQWEGQFEGSFQPVGSTEGLGDDQDPDYIEYDPNVKRYYSQGVWTFGLKALSVEGETVYTVGPKTVEINSFNTTIKISPDEIVPAVSSGVSSVTIQNFDFLLVDSPKNYGSTYYVQAEILPLNRGTGINAVTISKERITFNGNIGTIRSFKFDGSVGNGAYNLNLSLYEIVNGSPKKTGTVSYAFISVPGVDIIMKPKSVIDLYPSYYFDSSTDGESDITVDDGSVTNDITLTVKKGSDILSEENGIIKAGATDTLTVTVSDDPNSSSYLWLINGSPVTEGIDKSNKSLSISTSSYKGKTICITYMILGNSNLTKQSENVYVKIT
ncbi:MAG: hypothetical protein SPF69_07205 [Candidatus Ornithospirochaeta sp.]|nr:hypothetical protein [Sphaerochaetaceae bacterium]MDY5523857.1 hypothetical protein [Candidatus Ornithospirochaeta sp.]